MVRLSDARFAKLRAALEVIFRRRQLSSKQLEKLIGHATFASFFLF